MCEKRRAKEKRKEKQLKQECEGGWEGEGGGVDGVSVGCTKGKKALGQRRERKR